MALLFRSCRELEDSEGVSLDHMLRTNDPNFDSVPSQQMRVHAPSPKGTLRGRSATVL